MTSGLKVNFYKSCLMGINVDADFMEMACNFLNVVKGVFRFVIWVCWSEVTWKGCQRGTFFWSILQRS